MVYCKINYSQIQLILLRASQKHAGHSPDWKTTGGTCSVTSFILDTHPTGEGTPVSHAS